LNPRPSTAAAVHAALDEGRYVEIRGDAGVGKWGVLKHFAELSGSEARVVVLQEIPVRDQQSPPGLVGSGSDAGPAALRQQQHTLRRHCGVSVAQTLQKSGWPMARSKPAHDIRRDC
jgi:hypothetical protein